MPKDGDWWFEPGILTSGNDPAATLSNANFPDDYTPMIFITGDGHRLPPFGWTQRGVWPGFFAELVRHNGLVCHVEVFSDAVTIDSVPPALADVYRNHKVFGWELDLWKTVEKILKRIMGMRGELDGTRALPRGEIRDLTTDVQTITDLGYLQTQGNHLLQTWLTVSLIASTSIPATSLAGYDGRLRDYQNAAMALRCDARIHTEVARRIQAKIDEFSGDIHLITCGNEHLATNPLYRFLRPQVGCFGVVDPNRT